MPSKEIEPGIYQHRGGDYYDVIANGRNSNDCDQQMVVYTSLQKSDFPAGTIWIRTLKEFTTPGRFTKIEIRDFLAQINTPAR